MIPAQQLNLQHERSLSHKNLLPGSNPLISLGPCELLSQSLSLLLCLSNLFFPVSPQEVIEQIAAFITFFSQCELLFVTKEFITCALPVKYFTFKREHLILSASLRAKSTKNMELVFAKIFTCSRLSSAYNAHFTTIL